MGVVVELAAFYKGGQVGGEGLGLAALLAGLPVGVSFFGRAWSEPTLFKIAYAYEQATHRRQPPTYVPTLG